MNTSSWRARPVFLTSTFRDLHAERDCLVTVIFPQLRESRDRQTY